MDEFQSKAWLRNPALQTALGSAKFRVMGRNPMALCARQIVIDAGSGSRLLGFHSKHDDQNARGLIVLLHGWEGSSESAYIVSTGRFFFNRGYDIFRLNLRDHGASHHLNEGLFHGALIEETSSAVVQAARLAPESPLYIIGFSLGGNFALRIAALQNETLRIPNLRHTFCISPPLDPYKATLAIDKGALYRFYFIRKWKRSLKKKQSLFPHKYDFSSILRMRYCLQMTEAIMPYYPQYKNYVDYFGCYTIGRDYFDRLSTPVTVIVSDDDPVISPADFRNLNPNNNLRILMQTGGGHCGFFGSSPFDCWYEKKIESILMADNVVD